MASSFAGLNIGVSGLYAAQINLSTTSHNIANAETEGYSRQYTVQTASAAMDTGIRGMDGTGTVITDVLQYRESYLDDKYWDLNNELGEYETKDELLSQLELVLNEPSDYGYSTFVSDVFENLQTLSTDPSSSTAQTAFVESMDSLTSYINDVGSQLEEIQEDANFGIANCVDQINYYGEQIALLNQQISNLEIGGDVANDLRDQRALLVDELSYIVNTETSTSVDSNGQELYTVTINGQILVSDTYSRSLETVPREVADNPEDIDGLYDIYWSTGEELKLDSDTLSGELKGYIDIRDGNNQENFTGTLSTINADGSVEITNPSRTDLLDEGEISIDGTEMRYYSYEYDEATDTITFQLGVPAGVDGEDAVMENESGDSFTGTILSSTSTSVVVENLGDEDIPESGNVTLNGTTVTYTSYTKDAATGELTLNIEVPATAVGEETSIGDEMDFKGVPYYMEQLNDFVRTFAMEFNAINEQGDGDTGELIFTYEGYTGTPPLDSSDPSTYDDMTIHNVIINEAILDDPTLISNTADAGNGESANDLILDMLDLQSDTDMFSTGDPDDFMAALIAEMGVDANKVESLMLGQEDMVTLVTNQRLSVSGVDLNEETSNLIKFEQAYNLAAQVISVMNEIYDVTINSMGV